MDQTAAFRQITYTGKMTMSKATIHNPSRYAVLAAAILLFATSVQAQDLPKSADILKKSIDAMGGESAMRKRVQSHMTGTFELPAAGVSGTIEIFSAADPNRMLSLIDIPGIGTIRTGYDGTTAWNIHPAAGTQLIKGTQLEQTKQQADQLALLSP